MKRQLNITIDEETIQKVEAKAKEQNRTVSNYIDTLLKKDITQEE